MATFELSLDKVNDIQAITVNETSSDSVDYQVN